MPIAKTPGWLVRQRGVDERPQRALIELDPVRPGQLVIGNPVGGEDHRVTVNHSPRPAAPVLDLDRGDPLAADDAGDLGARRDRHAQGAAGQRERGVGRRRAVLGGHQHRSRAAVAQGEHGRPADRLGADDDRAPADVVR